MYSAEHNPRAPLPDGPSYLVAAQGITGMYANADYIAAVNTFKIEVL
jgi:hypothetical protein